MQGEVTGLEQAISEITVSRRDKARLWLEFFLFFLVAPLIVAIALPPRMMFPALFTVTGIGLLLLFLTPGFRLRMLGAGVFRMSGTLVLVTTLGTLATGWVILTMTRPEALWLIVARNPELMEKVARSGCRILSFGLESNSQEGLDRLNKSWVKVSDHERLLKRVNRAGIMAHAEFILGTDGDTPESIRELYRFAMRAKIAVARFYILTPIPGTDLYKQFKEEGRLLHEDYRYYTSTHCVFRPAKMTPDELQESYQWVIDRIYSLPSILRRTILNRNFLRHPLLHIYALMVNLDYRKLVRNGEAPNVH